MAPTKQWIRWTQKTKTFPKPKYGFSQHLRHIGDYVETHPITQQEYIQIKDAAKAWAYYHDVRISTKKYKAIGGKFIVRVTFISRTRKDQYEYSQGSY